MPDESKSNFPTDEELAEMKKRKRERPFDPNSVQRQMTYDELVEKLELFVKRNDDLKKRLNHYEGEPQSESIIMSQNEMSYMDAYLLAEKEKDALQAQVAALQKTLDDVTHSWSKRYDDLNLSHLGATAAFQREWDRANKAEAQVAALTDKLSKALSVLNDDMTQIQALTASLATARQELEAARAALADIYAHITNGVELNTPENPPPHIWSDPHVWMDDLKGFTELALAGAHAALQAKEK